MSLHGMSDFSACDYGWFMIALDWYIWVQMQLIHDVISCGCFKVCSCFHCIWMPQFIAWVFWCHRMGCLISDIIWMQCMWMSDFIPGIVLFRCMAYLVFMCMWICLVYDCIKLSDLLLAYDVWFYLWIFWCHWVYVCFLISFGCLISFLAYDFLAWIFFLSAWDVIAKDVWFLSMACM